MGRPSVHDFKKQLLTEMQDQEQRVGLYMFGAYREIKGAYQRALTLVLIALGATLVALMGLAVQIQ